ncbi:MAG: helix-turn-helix domain-containing protein [Chloroflexi bacterium]|nr:helix-turn-helix domain-containing protein [Chloroflexota bacterium]
MQAAGKLGVHPVTLRRWAKRGYIACMTTAGGHRRFAAADLDQFEISRSTSKHPIDFTQAWVDSSLQRVRHELEANPDFPESLYFTATDREIYQTLYARLVEVIKISLSNPEVSQGLLEEAESIGNLLSQVAIRRGMPVSMTLRIVLYFRKILSDTSSSLLETWTEPLQTSITLLRHISVVFDTVEVALAQPYDR